MRGAMNSGRGWRAAAVVAALLVLAPARGAVPQVVRLDPALDRLIAPGTRLERISDGHRWVEGPLWVGARHAAALTAARRGGRAAAVATRADVAGFLLFTDIPRNSVLRWRPGRGVDLFLHPSGYSGSAPFAGPEPGANGLTLDPQGRLVLAEHGDRRVSRLNADRTRTTLADRFDGRRLNSPNDVVYDSRGNLYFTDPPFGLPGTFDDPARELPFCGVYRLSPSGELQLLTRDLEAPNGIALSPDERTLYVTDVGARRPAWWALELDAGGGAVGRTRLFHDALGFAGNGPGGPDGLKTDRHGNVFATGPGGLYVFTPEARLLGRVDFGVATSNVAWDDAGAALYVTAATAVYRLPLVISATAH